MSSNSGEFTMNDFLRQIRQVLRLGSMQSAMKLIPGTVEFDMPDFDGDFKCIEGMIRAMTAEERESPGLIDHSRRCRIAKGSGRRVRDVIRLLANFEKMARMMEQMAAIGTRDRIRHATALFQDTFTHPDMPTFRGPRFE